jgi:hypothetical protein
MVGIPELVGDHTNCERFHPAVNFMKIHFSSNRANITYKTRDILNQRRSD